MTVNSYLKNIASHAVVKDAERDSIKRSISTISNRLDNYFGFQLAKHFEFGSSSRGTMLPRKMDKNSDVDYMVVFQDDSYRPQTYLDKLRRFATDKYYTSEIKQSTPTIVLSLNHVHFELVPALENFTWTGEYKIPDKASSYYDWTDTNPTEIQDKLHKANKEHNYLVKPLVRILKYWNAVNNYPYGTYELENEIIDNITVDHYFLFMNSRENIEDYFFDVVSNLSNSIFWPKYKREKIARLKQLSKEAYNYKNSYLDEENAVKAIKKLLPPMN